MAAPAYPQSRQTAEDNVVPVPFTDVAYEALRKVAAARGKDVADVIQEAINFAWYLDQALDEGARIRIERPDGRRETLTKR